MSQPSPAQLLDALLDQGIQADAHHATLKKVAKGLFGREPTKEELPALREALRQRAAMRESGQDALVIPPNQLTRPKVAIVGFTTHRKEAFDLGPDWEVWGINELHRQHPPEAFHRWFEIHDRNDFEPQGEGKPGDPEHLKSLATFRIPVYMHQHWDDIPPSVAFPKKEIEDYWIERGFRGKYQTSSISWEVALAVMMGAEEVGIFGVDMANGTEYAEQRPCLEYWMGVAEGVTGKPVRLPVTSDLCMAFGQYGFKDEGNQLRVKLEERLGWLHEEDNKRLQVIRHLDAEFKHKNAMLQDEYQTKREAVLKERHEFLGGIQDVHYILRSLMGTREGVAGNPTPDRSEDPQTGIEKAA